MASSAASSRQEDGSHDRSSHSDRGAAAVDNAFFSRASAVLARGMFVPAAGSLPSWRVDEFELVDAAQAELRGPKAKPKTRQVGGGGGEQ